MIEILDETGAVINTIAASKEFAQAHYPGRWRKVLVPSFPVSTEPRYCTPAQGLVALFAVKGITEDNVREAIEAIADDVQRYTARVAFERATAWQEGSPTMQMMQGAFELTDADMSALFDHAQTVVV